ncbi:hypothetical protein BG006_010173 [Podila minutissima]|uniref:Uncharacterized protein n=1 Tax=Podila minutissima TaxID=64525 RepID=A0A9P5STM7_9FUNG|nr:hypothetical protein BG006_010173 [Podila minutissima]
MSTPATSARAAPSPTIPSPNSVPASSTNGSSLNTPTSSSTCMSSFESDLDSKINDLRRSWTAGGACAGPDLMYNCVEYATFLPRPNTSKERSLYEKFPESITSNGKVSQYDWIAPRSPPAVSGWAAGTQYGFAKGYPRGALREFYDRYPSGSNVEAPRQGPKAEDYQVTLIPARPPLVDISNNIEMVQSLPPLMSPTIPPWPSSVPTHRAGTSATVAARTPRPTPTPTPTPIPPRSHIGGKQPGKLPMSTLHGNNSFSSDDDSSDSGSDSDASGNESDDHAMSEVETDPRNRKSIGRKTAEFSGTADRDSGAGQSPLSHARKSYSDNGVSLLTSEQVDALPSRRRGMVLSKHPVIVKITIPRTYRQALKSIGHSQADRSASSSLTKHRLPDSSDSEDRKKPKPKSKGKNLVSESAAIPWKRLPDNSDDDSDERKKSKPKAKARRSSADSDSDRDTKPAAETSQGQVKSAEVRKVAQRRGSVDRPHSRPIESKSLSPVMDRNRDRDRDRNSDRDKWKSYHSADEGEVEGTSKSHKSFRDKDKEKDKDAKVKTESKDRSEEVSSKESHKSESASKKDKYARNEPMESKSESGHARERSDSIIPKDTRDRTDLPQSRKDRDIKEESKEKSNRIEKPPSSAGKDRKEDDSSRTAGSSKTARSSTHGTTTAAPSSPSRRSSRDDAKDSSKSRGDKDSREDRTTASNKDARSSTSTSTGTTKDRARGRSRTRSRSRSPRGYYDRKRSPSSRDARDSKSTRDRREFDDDRSSSRRKKEGRQRDHSRDRNDRSSRGRSRDRSRDRFGRDRSRDRSTDRGNSRDRKRARSRSRERRTNRDTHSPPPSTRQDSHRSDSKQDSRPGLGRRESESHHGSSVLSASAARRPSQAVSSSIKEEASSTSATAAASSSSTAEAPSSTSGNVASASASAIKRVSIEDYQRKRGIVENKVETPKAAIDSPALASTTSLAGKVSLASNDSKDQPSSSSTLQREQKSSSSQPKLSNEVSKKAADYYNTFRLLRAEGTTHKHNADKTLKTQNNPRLGAVQYFLGAIDFIAAFQANDKYLALSNPGQPDVAMKESVHSWETMRQFIFALTNQCHQNHLTGLDGLSALVEVLVYFKVYSCHATLLRKEMLRSGQFKTKVSKEDIANGATVAVSAELVSRMMQNMEDWSHIQKRTEDVRQWLTPDIARAQFPETFARWLIHPDQVAAGTAGGYVPGTTSTAKIQWPLGTHLSLHTLMEMVVEAVKEFCLRHGLNGKPT